MREITSATPASAALSARDVRGHADLPLRGRVHMTAAASRLITSNDDRHDGATPRSFFTLVPGRALIACTTK